MLPEAFITHMAAGRLRIRIPSKKGEMTYFTSLKDQISGLPGIEKIEVNSLTGSVLVLHNLPVQEIDLKTLAGYSKAGGLFRLEAPNGAEKPVSEKISGIFKGADKGVRDFTRGQFDLPTVAVLGLLGVGLVQMTRGKTAAPAWHVAFWYAMNIFLNNQRNKPSEHVPKENLT
jgi:hypothetical protein